ncbi:MAG: hypothetical protein WB623_21340, partial [Candidatus Sulfotelmatobacter sp.]
MRILLLRISSLTCAAMVPHYSSTGPTRDVLDEFYGCRRVDSRSTSLGGISIFWDRIERFDAIRVIRS